MGKEKSPEFIANQNLLVELGKYGSVEKLYSAHENMGFYRGYASGINEGYAKALRDRKINTTNAVKTIADVLIFKVGIPLACENAPRIIRSVKRRIEKQKKKAD